MLAMNGRNGTPTIPLAQVKIFSGIGVKPAITSNQNAFHGDCAVILRSSATCASILSSQPSAASIGFTSS